MDVDDVVGGDGEHFRGVKVLLAREGLDDVAALAHDVQVVDDGVRGGEIGGGDGREDHEAMRAVLEGAANLGSVDGQLEIDAIADVDGGVVLEGVRGGRAEAAGQVEFQTITVVEAGVDGGVPSIVIVGGDVVADAEGTAAAVEAKGGEIGDGPGVGGLVFGVHGNAEMVLAGEHDLFAVRLGEAPGRHLSPVAAEGDASTLGDGDEVVGQGHVDVAEELGLDVLRLGLEERTELGAVSQDGNVDPRGGQPIRVVVALLRALKAVAGAIGVLAGELGAVALEILRGGEEAVVALTLLAVAVISVGFVAAEFGVGIELGAVGDSLGGGAITEQRVTHELQNDLTIDAIADAAAMLVGPLNVDERTGNELVGLDVVPATVVVLRIEEAVRVVSVTIGFVEPIVASGHCMQINIGLSKLTKHNNQEK